MKKIGLLFATIVMAMLFAVSASALEPTGQCGDNVYWSYDNATHKLVISGEGEMYDYGDKSTLFCSSNIESVIIEEGVTSIGANAFWECNNLVSVTITDSIANIGDFAFGMCTALRYIDMPNSITSIGYGTFYACSNLKSVSIPDGVISIGGEAFVICSSLTHITIPNSVNSIGGAAFHGCENLSNIYYAGTNEQWNKISIYDYNNSLADATIHYLLKTGKCGDDVTYVLYDDGKLVISGNGDMYHYNNSSTPFYYSYIKSVVIEEGVTSVGECAFYYSTKLTSVSIPDSVTSIGKNAFYCCSNLTDISLPDVKISIGYEAFWGTAYYANSENWDNNVLYIGKHLIGANIAGDYTVKNGTLTIAGYAFSGCENLTSIIMPNSLIDIGYRAFGECYNLKSITIPDSIMSISSSVFFNCKKISTVYYDGTQEQWEKMSIGANNNLANATIYFLVIEKGKCGENITYKIYDDGNLIISGSGEMYNYGYSSSNKSPFYNGNIKTIVVEDGVTSIGDYAFYCCEKLTSINFSNSMISIGEWSFYNCTSLTNIKLNDNIASVGDYAFYNCYGLSDIEIGKNVTLGYLSFADCRGITNITVDKNNVLYSTDEYGVLFDKNKTNLILYPVANRRTKYEIPNTVTYISAWSFYDSSYLEEIVVPDSVIEIKLNAFSKSQKLKSITIPGSVKTCEQILTYCESLESVVICEGVINIDEHAFTDCYKLKEVTLPNSIKVIDTAAFNRCGLSDVYYYGCQNEWSKIYIENEYGFNDYLVEASIHFIHSHSYIPEITKVATHISEGEITYTCICDDKYTESIAKIEGHSYISEVTKEPTHLEEGETTYICECGDSYTESIAKLEGHTYTSEVTKESTHLEEGEKTYTCECGDSYTKPITKLEGHTYTSEITKEATHTEEGILIFTCECGDTYNEPIAKLEEHSYVANIILPTCSEKGYTEHICECGKSYVSDYVGMIAHSYVYSVIKPSSHLVEGLGRYTCSKCGYHYDEAIAKTKEHSYIATMVDSTCTDQGYTLNECECGDSYKTNYLAKIDHVDSNSDGVCDDCGYDLAENCSCNCHSGGIKGLIFRIILFFQKLFRTNQFCEGCGIRHY